MKRQRTKEPKNKDQTPPVQSTYWFDDGNVILQADNTQFRVHRSLLSRHSSVFRDMFSLPQPATDPGHTPEGCPVVFLSDRVKDLECVLSTFYDNIRVHGFQEKMTIDFLGAILRLGKKYEIDYLCEEGLKRLRLEFPTTLEKWHSSSFVEGEETYLREYTHIECGDATNLESAVLGLGHELSILSCLPSAYLVFVSSNTLEDILGSSVNCGGTLDHEIVMRCVRGRDKLIHAYHSLLEEWIDEDHLPPSPGCSSKSICVGLQLRVIRSLSIFEMEDWSHSFLKPWDTESVDRLNLCVSCLESVKEGYEWACENLWSRLPKFFGLLPWDKLKDFDM